MESTDSLRTLARYPFLSGAKKYVESLGMTLDKIGSHPVYSSAIGLAKQRILDMPAGNFKPPEDEKTDQELLMLSYPIARILSSAIGDRIVSGRYAAAEAETAYEKLRTEDKKTIDAIKEDLGLKANTEINLPDYLRLASRLAKKDAAYKLINRTVSRGMVSLSPGDDLQLLKEAIRQKVLEPVNVKNIPSSMKKTVNELKTMLLATSAEEPQIEFLEEKAVPPCIAYVIGLLQSNQANHNARFILATFLVGVGLKEDQILKIFSTSPKYEEEKTRYQLGFLTGEKGNTRYTCPACATIKTYGLCKADCKVKHPQQYYRNNERTAATSSPSSKGS
jgi:DNA primase large subunit